MSDIIYNANYKERGVPFSYSRKRSFLPSNPYKTLKHIQKTNRLDASHYTSIKSDMEGSRTIANQKHGSYNRYLRQIKSRELKSNGRKLGIVDGCHCNEDVVGEWVSPIDINERIITQDKSFNINDNVYAMRQGNNFYEKGVVTSIIGEIYEIKFHPFNNDNTSREEMVIDDLQTFFECPCGSIKNGVVYISSGTKDEAEASGCNMSDTNKKDYFVQMNGFYKRVCLN